MSYQLVSINELSLQELWASLRRIKQHLAGGYSGKTEKVRRDLMAYTDKPQTVIYNGNTTICIFADGTKVLSRPMEGDTFDKSTGVAMCIAKYVCGSRTKFQKLVSGGDDQTPDRDDASAD